MSCGFEFKQEHYLYVYFGTEKHQEEIGKRLTAGNSTICDIHQPILALFCELWKNQKN